MPLDSGVGLATIQPVPGPWAPPRRDVGPSCRAIRSMSWSALPHSQARGEPCCARSGPRSCRYSVRRTPRLAPRPDSAAPAARWARPAHHASAAVPVPGAYVVGVAVSPAGSRALAPAFPVHAPVQVSAAVRVQGAAARRISSAARRGASRAARIASPRISAARTPNASAYAAPASASTAFASLRGGGRRAAPTIRRDATPRVSALKPALTWATVPRCPSPPPPLSSAAGWPATMGCARRRQRRPTTGCPNSSRRPRTARYWSASSANPTGLDSVQQRVILMFRTMPVPA